MQQTLFGIDLYDIPLSSDGGVFVDSSHGLDVRGRVVGTERLGRLDCRELAVDKGFTRSLAWAHHPGRWLRRGDMKDGGGSS
jgi:hypothetical protein